MCDFFSCSFTYSKATKNSYSERVNTLHLYCNFLAPLQYAKALYNDLSLTHLHTHLYTNVYKKNRTTHV